MTEIRSFQTLHWNYLLQSFSHKAHSFKWSNMGSGVLDIQRDDPEKPNRKRSENILVNYSSTGLTKVKNVVESYIGTSTREVQDDQMLFNAVMDSLSNLERPRSSIAKMNGVWLTFGMTS